MVPKGFLFDLWPFVSHTVLHSCFSRQEFFPVGVPEHIGGADVRLAASDKQTGSKDLCYILSAQGDFDGF